MAHYYISLKNFDEFINNLKVAYKVFSPLIKDAAAKKIDYFYAAQNDANPFVFNAYRAIEPLKSFFTSPKDEVATYFKEPAIPIYGGEIIIFGVKSCDIAGHKIQDFVFLEGAAEDTLYKARRENTIIVSGDCTDFKEVCHCLAWDILPHPTEGFDLNLSPLDDGYVVETGSEKGEGLIQRYKEYFILCQDQHISSRNHARRNLIECLKKHLAPQNLVSKDAVQRLVRQGYNLDTWQQSMLTCVECGGCNLICDTCHCFLLMDDKKGNTNSKVRLWDSCQYANFSRVAGGANPLRSRMQRLRNRFLKKFDFFVDNLGMPACCGCGRCIEVCPAKIDIREVLKDLAEKIKSVH